MQLIIEIPSREEQLAFNRQRWGELLLDRDLAALPYRVETNVHGQVIMNPPPSGEHSFLQGEIAYRLRQLHGGRTLPECPISTLDGVKAADIGWYSEVRFGQVSGSQVFEVAPEICVEVLSASNTKSEMKEKKQLYFEAGAEEVWFCRDDGTLEFYWQNAPSQQQPRSARCPNFPLVIHR